MSNIELDDDVVLAKFINYMQKALYLRRLNYYRNFEKIREFEVRIDEIEDPGTKDFIAEDISSILNSKEIYTHLHDQEVMDAMLDHPLSQFKMANAEAFCA